MTFAGKVHEEIALREVANDMAKGNENVEGWGGNFVGSSGSMKEEGDEGGEGGEDDVIKLLANGDEVQTPETVIGQLTNDYHERAKALQLCDGEDGNGRLEDSIADFDIVIERNYKNAHAYFRRAFCHKSLGNYDRAAEDFERARALDPNNPNLAINYRNIGDVECIILVDAGREPVF